MFNLEDCRKFYAEEIRLIANLQSPPLVEAFARVPREKFLGPPPWQIASPEQRLLSLAGMGKLAYASSENPEDVYHNVLVALDAAHDINNGQPSALARWIDDLELMAGDRVYHLGCGVGYYTAVMAEVVGPSGSVAGSEVHRELAKRAQRNLSGYPNVTVHAGDGVAFDPGDCDAMLINAGVTHPHRSWLGRLREGGRLVAPITMAASLTVGQGVMVKIVRVRGGFSAHVASVVGILSCTSARDPQLEPLVAKAFTSRALFKLKSVRLDSHEPVGTCILHGPSVCMSSADLPATPPPP